MGYIDYNRLTPGATLRPARPAFYRRLEEENPVKLIPCHLAGNSLLPGAHIHQLFDIAKAGSWRRANSLKIPCNSLIRHPPGPGIGTPAQEKKFSAPEKDDMIVHRIGTMME